MVQYEKKVKKKVQSIIYEANRRGVLNEISLGQCEKKRTIAEGKLEKLRVQVAALLHKFQLVSVTFCWGIRLYSVKRALRYFLP